MAENYSYPKKQQGRNPPADTLHSRLNYSSGGDDDEGSVISRHIKTTGDLNYTVFLSSLRNWILSYLLIFHFPKQPPRS